MMAKTELPNLYSMTRSNLSSGRGASFDPTGEDNEAQAAALSKRRKPLGNNKQQRGEIKLELSPQFPEITFCLSSTDAVLPPSATRVRSSNKHLSKSTTVIDSTKRTQQSFQGPNKTFFSTPILDEMNLRFFEIYNALRSICDEHLLEVLSASRRCIPAVHSLRESLSAIDVLLCFAETAATLHFTPPKMLNHLSSSPAMAPGGANRFGLADPTRMALLSAFCPFSQQHTQSTDNNNNRAAPPPLQSTFKPFDVHLSEANYLLLLSGSNGGGKSTFLKTIALIVLLAHVGSHVPAQFAAIRVLSKFFARLDCTNERTSSQDELADLATLTDLESHGATSLALVDEPLRVSPQTCAAPLIWSVCERLLRSGCSAVVVTHFEEVKKMSLLYSVVNNLYVTSPYISNQEMKYAIYTGNGEEESYGLDTAKFWGCSAEMIQHAYSHNRALEDHETAGKTKWKQVENKSKEERQILDFAISYLSLTTSNLDTWAMLEWLRQKQVKIIKSGVNLNDE
eukprot:GDKJ01011387.1.p1 GENE.GDKJ01011387.1~~GDKJ01011387.1.p1  ORF type:complete len:511 (+),score=98.94 GDKJ01011387.1:1029-2561(+)